MTSIRPPDIASSCDGQRFIGDVFYDADCSFCVRVIRRFEPVLSRHDFRVLPLQSLDARERLGLRDDELLEEMRLRLEDGTVFGGADAVVEIARRVSWAWPLWALSRLPGVMPLMQGAYREFAARRGCRSESCRTGARRPVTSRKRRAGAR